MNKSNKRQLEIIDILKRDKFVKVWQLSEFFGVANRTIQYDLSYLKKKRLAIPLALADG